MGEGLWTRHFRGGLVEYVFYPIIFHKFRPLDRVLLEEFD